LIKIKVHKMDAEEIREEEIQEKEEKAIIKIKPEIDEKIKKLMQERKKKPEFLRQQWWAYKRIDKNWRRPRGRHSKLRRHYGYRPPLPRIGYSSPKKVRGLHPSGFREVMVYNVDGLENIDVKKEAIRIAHGVGKKKRHEIIAKADEMGIRVLNRVL